ncbi:ABC transporter substrate-binding protein [Rhodococcus sp. NPDC055024]
MKIAFNKSLLGAGLVLVAITASACGSDSDGGTDPNTVRFGALRSLSNAGMATAESNGYFTDEGITYSTLYSDSGPAQLQAVVSGDLDVATGVTSVVFGAIDNGSCLKVLRPLESSEFNLIARKELGLQTNLPYKEAIAQLKGKTIGVPARGGGPESLLTMLLTDAGLDPAKDVTFVAIGAGAAAATAVSTGRVDATLENAQLESALDTGGTYDTILPLLGDPNGPLADYFPAFAVASCDWVEKNPELVTRFCKAIDRGYTTLATDPQAGPRALVNLQIARDEAKADVLWSKYGTAVLEIPSLDEDRWEKQGHFTGNGRSVPAYSETVEGACAHT